MKKRFFLDGSTQACPSALVLNERDQVERECFLPLEASYTSEQKEKRVFEQALQKMQNFFCFDQNTRWALTSCGEEAIQTVFETHLFQEVEKTGKNFVMLSSIEEAPFHLGVQKLERLGLKPCLVDPESSGILSVRQIEKKLSSRVSMLSLSWAHPTLGTLQPLWEIADFCEKKGILLHVDVSCVLGKLLFSFTDLPIDYLTLSGSLFAGLKSIGLLLAKEGFQPLIPDQAMQGGVRGSSFDLAGFSALAAAFDEAYQNVDRICSETAGLRDHLANELKKRWPEAEVLFENSERNPNVLLIAFPGLHAEVLQYSLAQQGVFVGIGGGRSQRLESILQKLQFSNAVARSAIHLSLSPNQTQEEVEEIIQQFEQALATIQKVSLTI